jgi:hypothetical protein
LEYFLSPLEASSATISPHPIGTMSIKIGRVEIPHLRSWKSWHILSLTSLWATTQLSLILDLMPASTLAVQHLDAQLWHEGSVGKRQSSQLQIGSRPTSYTCIYMY